jgi:hypothetical protein
MEGEDLEFHERVGEAFLNARGPGFHHIDASGSPDDIEQEAWDLCRALVDGTMAGPAGST